MDYLKTNKKFLVNDIAINQYVIEKSHSGYVVLNKKKYLDLTCGNGSTIFGFNNKFISKQITDQLNNALTLPSNYISTLKCELAVKFCSYSHLKKCFVTNTTQNALDYCLMFAQQFYYKQGLKRDKIIAVNCHDFNENYINITQNEADLHDACNKPNVCAVLLNLVDFEDKYDVISPTFITKAREFTKLNNLILIINETYSAIKTGAFFSFQKFGIKPDMVIVGDSVTNGLPFGAVLMKEAIAEFAEPMLTIENENLLSYAVAVAVFDKYTDSKTIAKQTDLQELIKKLLVKINNNCIETISNIGFCVSIGFVKDFSTEKLKIALYNKKILAFFENDILTINFPVSVSEGKIKFVLKTLRKVLLKLNPAVKTSKKVKAKTETLLTIEEENTAKQAKIKNKNKNKNKQAEQQIPLASSLKKLDDFVHTLESDTSLNVENASLNAKNRAVNIEDIPLIAKNRTVNIEDIPLDAKNRAVNIEDDSLNIEDIPLNTKNNNGSLNIEDTTLNAKNRSLNIEDIPTDNLGVEPIVPLSKKELKLQNKENKKLEQAKIKEDKELAQAKIREDKELAQAKQKEDKKNKKANKNKIEPPSRDELDSINENIDEEYAALSHMVIREEPKALKENSNMFMDTITEADFVVEKVQTNKSGKRIFDNDFFVSEKDFKGDVNSNQPKKSNFDQPFTESKISDSFTVDKNDFSSTETNSAYEKKQSTYNPPQNGASKPNSFNQPQNGANNQAENKSYSSPEKQNSYNQGESGANKPYQGQPNYRSQSENVSSKTENKNTYIKEENKISSGASIGEQINFKDSPLQEKLLEIYNKKYKDQPEEEKPIANSASRFSADSAEKPVANSQQNSALPKDEFEDIYQQNTSFTKQETSSKTNYKTIFDDFSDSEY